MGLFIRMALYAASAFVAGLGWASFDDASGTLSVNVDDLAVIIGGAVTFVATFISSRIAKRLGGKT